jgi:hypothetical protein
MITLKRKSASGRRTGNVPKRLRRYTSLPVALDMLIEKRLTIVDCSRWADINDQVGMREYQKALHYGFVGAMCLTMAPETFHHWQVFAGDSSGVAIEFDVPRFLHMVDGDHRLCGPVDYVRLDEIKSVNAEDIHRLPFMKRAGFIDEAEYRVVGYAVEALPALHIPLERDAVQRIIVSPFIHPSLVPSLRQIMTGIAGWRDLRVTHSRLTDSQTWQRAIRAFPERHGIIYTPWLES